MAKEKKKKKGGYYGKLLGACAIAACAIGLALGMFTDIGGFGFGDRWGLPQLALSGGGGENGGNNYGDGSNEEVTSHVYSSNEDAITEENDEPLISAETEIPHEPLLLVIRVSGHTIYHGEEELSQYGLVLLLEESYNSGEGHVWELRDDRAILDTLNTVRALFSESGVDFMETAG